MRRSRLFLGTLTLAAAAAVPVVLLLAPPPRADALPPFICLQEKTTPIVSGSGPTCAAALADAESQAAALVPCGGETCLEVFEVTQQCIGRVICNGSCHADIVASGRMRYRCRVEL
jgi:hypothetical protein